jgi:hypothetical protein
MSSVDRVSRSGAVMRLGKGLILLACCGTWYLVARGLTSRTDRIIQELSDSSNQVSSAAEQVSTTSQQLALESKEQAASNEAVTSALSEMDSVA